MALDERLRGELDRAAQPADPSGIYEHLIRRRERRRIGRKVGRGVLAVAVVVGSIAGVYGRRRSSNRAKEPPVSILLPSRSRPMRTGGSRSRSRRARDLNSAPSCRTDPGRGHPDAAGDALAPRVVSGRDEDRRLDLPERRWRSCHLGDERRRAEPCGGRGRECERALVVSGRTTIAYTARVEGRTEIHSFRADGTTIASCTPRALREPSRRFRRSSPPTARRSCSTGNRLGLRHLHHEVDADRRAATHEHGTDYDPHWSPERNRNRLHGTGDRPSSTGVESDFQTYSW